MTEHIKKVIAYYDENAAEVVDRLHTLSHEGVLPEVDALLPEGPFKLLDIGAGSGRDAIWYAEQGHQVTAVEPAENLRMLGMQNTAGHPVRWLGDALPELPTLHASTRSFDVILLSAVWMFLPPDSRLPTLLSLKKLLAPAGHIIMTVQTATGERNELKYFTTPDEFAVLAAESNLELLCCKDIPDSKGRPEWRWQLVVLTHPLVTE